jgi:hypothetical protein
VRYTTSRRLQNKRFHFSHAIKRWRKNRFGYEGRGLIKEAAECILEVCEEHDVVDRHEPALEPEDIQGTGVEEEEIRRAVQRATDLGFEEFKDPRAGNAKYALQA